MANILRCQLDFIFVLIQFFQFILLIYNGLFVRLIVTNCSASIQKVHLEIYASFLSIFDCFENNFCLFHETENNVTCIQSCVLIVNGIGYLSRLQAALCSAKRKRSPRFLCPPILSIEFTRASTEVKENTCKLIIQPFNESDTC